MSRKDFTVLLIEGDASESSLVKRFLADAGEPGERFDVTEAVRVSSACQALAHADFDVVILDLEVPQNVGLEGLHRIRAQRPNVPVILLASLQDEPLAAQGVKLGAQDYLVKGTIDCCVLKRAIRWAVEKKKLTSLVEQLINKDGEAKVVVDEGAVVLYANPAAEALFGVPAEELRGKPFAYPREAGAVTIVSPRSSELSAEMSVSGIDWNGQPARLISFRDSRPRPEPVDGESRRLEDIKNQFTRRLSHEMRNTLSTVKTAAFCLKDGSTGPLSPRQARLVDMISRNVDRQIRIFDKIGDLARFQAGKLKFDFRPVELAPLIEEFSREAELRSPPRRLEIEAPSGLPAVYGDADLLLQVLRGLLDNAFRHAKDKVVLKASAEGDDEVRVVVADDGEGIPKERLGSLFTPFAELDRRTEAGGFKGGLSLTMSREIIEGHKGRIWAESDERGARFIFTLPRRAKPSREEAEKKIFVSHSRSRPIYAATGSDSKDRP